MFGFRKDKKNKNKSKVKKTAGLSREEIIAEAMGNARKAREEIGQDTLEKIAEAMLKKEKSATEQAKQKIKSMNNDRVAEHLRDILDEK